jgi:RNA polymerase sigma-70 factor (ECF subfamily)
VADHGQAWQGWLERYGAALLLFARQWSASAADAEDALQSGFVRFWKTRSRARDELAYLYTCVRSAACDQVRSNQRRKARELRVARPEPSAFDSSLERCERDAAIEAALAQLPGDQREVVVMKIWGGLTFAQIAAALEITLGTAASRYRYALARMEADLSKEVRP